MQSRKHARSIVLEKEMLGEACNYIYIHSTLPSRTDALFVTECFVAECLDVIRATSPFSPVLFAELLWLELESEPATSHSQLCAPPYVPKLQSVCL